MRALVVALAVTVPATSHFATAQDRHIQDIADRVFHGPKFRGATVVEMPRKSDEYVVAVRPGASVASVANRHGLQLRGRMQTDGWFVLRGNGDQQTSERALRSDPDVFVAGNNESRNYKLCGFTPNDPYFFPNNLTVGWQGQWHLQNNIGGTIDADVSPAWSNGWTGANVVIGIVDDCLQKDHPDLSPNFTPSNSYDFGQNDTDPSPVYGTDQHGTSVAGVAAARGGNGIGVTGAAPFGRLAGLRVDFTQQNSQEFADATMFHSTSGSESIKIKNHSYGYTAPFISTDLERQALALSAAIETIHVFAAGNERGNSAQDSNTLDLQSSPDAITVAALGEDGKFASYSSFGSNVFVCAPSSSANLPAITTTDVVGGNGYDPSLDTFPDQNYTTIFGGTSSASPLVSGILALAKQANPALNERLAKHLLVRSCNIVDQTDATAAGGWIVNAAGFRFNENYGFGCIDANRLVNNALMYQGVTKLQTEVVGPITDGQTIPDNNATGISHSFNITSQTPLEDVEVQIDITHPYRGDLEIWLQSPSGTLSRVKSTALGATSATSDSGADIHWTFSSNAFWGESPQGTWKVIVKDLALADVGKFQDFTFTAHMGLPVLKDNALFVSQGVPSNMIAGQSYNIGLIFQNNGFSTWNRSAWYLRSENPSANTNWGFSTVSLSSSDNIAPGNSKTFNIKVIAPMDGGTYDMQWRMRHSAYASFGDFSPDVTVTVTVMPDAARFLTAASIPTSVTAGSSFPVSFTFRNVGTNAWVAGSPYHLKAVTSSTKWGNPTVSLSDGDNILRGSDKTFSFTAVAPATAGAYTMQWRMEDGTTQFGELTPGYKIKVVAP